MTKLVIQIPCFNEEVCLLKTLSDLPKTISGIDEIEILVVNDGSTDKTKEIAQNFGASVIDVYPQKGLANAFITGISHALNLGADIIVNTDADNQYCASDIERLIAPILNGQADFSIGVRDINSIKEFSFVKKILQKFGSKFFKLFSELNIDDAPSGFRAFSREAAFSLNISSNYTYTLENLIQIGEKKFKVVSVPIRTNAQHRSSRLVKSNANYIFRQANTLLNVYPVYHPKKLFLFCVFVLTMCVAIPLLLCKAYSIIGIILFFLFTLSAIGFYIFDKIVAYRRFLENKLVEIRKSVVNKKL